MMQLPNLQLELGLLGKSGNVLVTLVAIQLDIICSNIPDQILPMVMPYSSACIEFYKQRHYHYVHFHPINLYLCDANELVLL